MPGLKRDEAWQRLDPRMLLVHPIRELVRFLPFVVVAFLAGSASGGADLWHWLALAVPVALGLLRYLTTGFRITEGRVELRRGLLNRHVLSTPVDRVRTVDLTASPVHRVLGLSTVRIGTGQAAGRDEERLDLDALPTARARDLRGELLRRAEAGTLSTARPEVDDVVVRFDPAWLLYAPLTSAGVVIAAALLGGASQLLNALDLWDRLPEVDGGLGVSWWLAVALGLVSAAVLVSVLAVAGSALTNWGLTLTRSRVGGAGWELRRGLLTTRETSIDADRVRGVTLGEPLGLRLAGAARLSAVVSGLDRKQRGSAVLVPPAPADLVARVAETVLTARGPVTGHLSTHGPRAVRRRWTRALLPATAAAALVVGGVALLDLPTGLMGLAVVPLLVGAGLAADRARALGHRLDPGVLTVRSGSLVRRRTSLQTAGVIGWTFRSTPFQRRAGLATLVATTAGGRQAYPALDLPTHLAVALADRASPGLLTPFLSPSSLEGS